MKYCKNCGMLLEDSLEHCIRCGTDVSNPQNVSKYPIKVLETMEAVTQQKKKTGKIAAFIIGLIVLLAVLIGGCIYAMGNGVLLMGQRPAPEKSQEKTEKVETVSEESEAAPKEDSLKEEVKEKEEAAKPEAVAKTQDNKEKPKDNVTAKDKDEAGTRTVKDDKGKYYNIVSETDDAGNVIFSTVYPEDLVKNDFYRDYGVYSTVFPMSMDFTAYNEDNSVRFTYLSPKHFWYKKSETGKSLDDAADVTNYMTYCIYESPTSYLDILLKKNYPGAKFEIVNEYDISDAALLKIDELASQKSKSLFFDIGDYAAIGMDTTYTNMDYASGAKIYEYEITLKDKTVLRCKYFIPFMANNLMYASESANDRGVVTEWFCFGIACLEAGNDDLYDEYCDDFDMFAINSFPSEYFMYALSEYAKEIRSDIEESREVSPMTKAKLKLYASDFASGKKTDEFYSNVLDMLNSSGKKMFSLGKGRINTSETTEVVFVDKEKGKLFISPEKDEYPGEEYEEYKSGTVTENASDDSGENQ